MKYVRRVFKTYLGLLAVSRKSFNKNIFINHFPTCCLFVKYIVIGVN